VSVDTTSRDGGSIRDHEARNYGDREWSNASLEICAFGPKGSAPFGLYESALVRVEQSSTVIVYSGSSPHGQGEETTFAQLVAEEFSIPVENVMIIHGGIAQGVGRALWEGVEYTEDGQLLTAMLMDYAMLLACEFLTFELDHTITLTPVNPLGAKGIGESGTVGAPPAVADALGMAHVDMPFKAEKLWNIIHQK
jgi:CO/xanthine dehydrogenase Mo-binding subunit